MYMLTTVKAALVAVSMLIPNSSSATEDGECYLLATLIYHTATLRDNGITPMETLAVLLKNGAEEDLAYKILEIVYLVNADSSPESAASKFFKYCTSEGV